MTYSYGKDYHGNHIVHDSTSNTFLLLNGEKVEIISETSVSLEPISAIIGTIKLKLNNYLIIATDHKVTGSILGNRIAKIEKFDIINLKNNPNKESKEETIYLKLLTNHLNSSTLYFSINNTYDLTNSLQRQFTSNKPTYDVRFWWNHYLCQSLLLNNGSNFITPIIYGYFKSHIESFNSFKFEFSLLTRRSIFRAGTRYFRRGIDSLGNVANFNETEQIFNDLSNNSIFSFLQIRGSIPVYWAEINNLKYKPNLIISNNLSLESTKNHFTNLIDLYGDIHCINLVNSSGYESPIKLAFESSVQSIDLNKIHYIYFDFHHQCSKMRWHRINLLLDKLIDQGLTSSNYFHYDLNQNKIISLQNKITRTNCMDCLDRTNVVQSTIARWVLQNQFTKSNYLNSDKPWESLNPQFNFHYQNFWADNADAVSNAYSGTGALKTDFTRLGKRTKKGALADLQNSISRYYKNNLSDGSRQDSFDLFLGIYKPWKDNIGNPFIDTRSPYDQLLPYLIGTSILILVTLLKFPNGSIFDYKNLFIVAGLVFFNIKSIGYLLKNGNQFVNWPKLVELDFLKKNDVVDSNKKLVGTKYTVLDNFKVVSKKSS